MRKVSLSGILLTLITLTCSVHAKLPRALDPGTKPDDVRLEPLKDLNGYFPFENVETKSAWEKRSRQVRRQMAIALGVWPKPSPTPLNPVIHGKIDRGDYTVEKAYFESVPGFYVTGNLYRPKGKGGKVPGILCPHGHWANGRFYDQGVDQVKKEIASGAEKFEEGGRSPLQSRCVTLARMGCVVFHYDMIGYADSVQISYEIAHRFNKQRPEMNTKENWGLYSPQAEAHMQSVLGLQTINGMRSVDFLLTLPEVDANRIGVTGASGGGTQTFILGALDPRPAVVFPAVMVSTAMQGGCTCENAALLRVGTGNIEFAALAWPKPVGLTAANDWTKEMATKGFPELKKHYAMLGAPDDVMLLSLTQFGHNYNYPSRAGMYSWMNKHLELGLEEPIVEKDYKRLSTAEMTVWDESHPKPEGGAGFECKLLAWLHEDSQKQLSKNPKLSAQALETILGRTLETAGSVDFDLRTKEDRGVYLEMAGLLRNSTYKEQNPTVFLYPKNWNGRVVIGTHADGKAALFQEDGSPVEPVRTLLEAGITVVGIDLLQQGEFLGDGESYTHTEVKIHREAACFTLGYNDSLFVQRVHDVLSLVKLIRNHERGAKSICLAALDETAPILIAARTQLGDAVAKTAVNTNGFRFGNLLDLENVNFLPGGAKYGDIPGMLSMGRGKLWLAGDKEDGAEIYTGAADGMIDAAVDWLRQ